MSGSAVHVTGRLGTPDLSRFKSLIPEAVTRAIYATQRDLKQYLMNPMEVPFLTGKLQKSVVSFVSPGQLVFQWSALDPSGTYDYAKIRDERGSKHVAAGWSDRILQIAKAILKNHLEFELQAIVP